MKRFLLGMLIVVLSAYNVHSQNTFEFQLELVPINLSGLPGLHSYAVGQHEGKWLIVGGRVDGLHARQPFNAFPESQNNDTLYVVDVQAMEVWSAPLSSLTTSIQEQLQSTNMNFYQDQDTLFIIGGYAFSPTANDHVTFPFLTSIDVPATINAIINNQPFSNFIKQVANDVFAVTGGQLGKLNNYFYLIGGHRFDGRYNPMGGASYVQEYTNQIRKFTIDNSGSQLSFDNYQTLTDNVHLHRRDYNLLPQIFPGGNFGYTISSGVFQLIADLPYPYPVDIDENSITPHTEFNQYLSNYHSASTSLYDSNTEEMHNLFFGGMSQYYYSNGTLIQDNNVPFVKTISLLTRHQDGSFEEFVLPIEMPLLEGASAEFITNKTLPLLEGDIISLSEVSDESFIIGHIFGGIESPLRNPFNSNQTNQTQANPTIYEVRLNRNPLDLESVNGLNPYTVQITPNPTKGAIQIQLNKKPSNSCYYFVSDIKGSILDYGSLDPEVTIQSLTLPDANNSGILFLTLNIDNRYYLDHKILISN